MILTLLSFITGIIGAILLAFGAWLLLPAAGFIVGGILCLLWSFLVSYMMSRKIKQ
ncbi:hypothetical protein QE197_09545 [Arsenophonus nasoniae]|uniref:Uncharacterized protein n=1 Tax=Arsenophonus nasoniae TaxID=638 RepID=A0A4P7KWR6_9GAMM|nr:hypothetical protein [Arsenophonus nasoniae]QBY42640.1 hypothetical protein ArsFIN_11980 [Arsenophonus nasoniae]QBY43475.1 hypothetical protein ArsFIN_20420 [Arsenophonus nasoniae]QBY43685.1 hypothetical protein ArsFIN_22530 [Arsenophonus nasoniae]QBY44769.1 hypothetical protein ArsFIN_33550 [Arsenophonus nasoniae]WGM04966.1 hypothetical protein QE258_15455 [Arsenophonus nasoniae]